MSDVEKLDDAAAFLAAAEPLLLADEARHNLVLGIAGTIRDSPDLYPVRNLWLVRDAGEVVGAAMQTPPYNLILARPRTPQALAALAAAVAGEDLPGVVGSVPEVESFAELWAALRGATARSSMRQGVYALEQVEAPPAVPGRPRVATLDDRDLALRWWIDFGTEVLHEGGPAHDRAEISVDHRLSAPNSGFLLWEDGGETGLPRGLGRADPERHSHRPGLHAAGAARARLRDRADGGAVAAAPRRTPLRGGPPLLLPLHRPRQPHLERDLRADRLSPCRRVGGARLRLARECCALARWRKELRAGESAVSPALRAESA